MKWGEHVPRASRTCRASACSARSANRFAMLEARLALATIAQSWTVADRISVDPRIDPARGRRDETRGRWNPTAGNRGIRRYPLGRNSRAEHGRGTRCDAPLAGDAPRVPCGRARARPRQRRGWRYYPEDSVSVDADGYITFLGRIDDAINVAGRRFSTRNWSRRSPASPASPKPPSSVPTTRRPERRCTCLLLRRTATPRVNSRQPSRTLSSTPSAASPARRGRVHARPPEDALGQDYAPAPRRQSRTARISATRPRSETPKSSVNSSRLRDGSKLFRICPYFRNISVAVASLAAVLLSVSHP